MVAASLSHTSHAKQGARIDVRNVTHRFALRGEALPVLDDISLTIEPGEFVALLGPSGCGKSTLLRLVAGLDAPAQGVIHADGETVTGPDPSRVVVFQDPTLFPWRTVRDNVALGPQAQRVRSAMRQSVSMPRSNSWACRRSRKPFRISSREGWRSARRSRALSSTIRNFSCSTNRSASSTR
ncbi:ABC-type Fe3+/spermidine/putrescine transport system ATPase subunit [Paraburkholderia youngii]